MQERSVFLHGRPWELPDLVYQRLKESDTGDFLLVTNKIITAQMLGGIGEGFAVVSLYPMWWGRQYIVVLALIVLCVLSIILLALSIRYNISGQLPFWKGAVVMADNNGKKNVVHEIDREISDLVEDKALPEKAREPVVKKGAVSTKQEQDAHFRTADEGVIQKPGEESPAEETRTSVAEVLKQDLEKDGIIIKKG